MFLVLKWCSVQVCTQQQAHILRCPAGGEVAAHNKWRVVCELPIAMLACARIGAVHSIIFGGFSAESLAQRMENCK